MMTGPWLLYGANGYTGQLIAREAVMRGHKPILAARSAGALEPLARELSLTASVFSLDDPGRVDAVLQEARDLARGGRPVYVNARIGRTDFRKGSISM